MKPDIAALKNNPLLKNLTYEKAVVRLITAWALTALVVLLSSSVKFTEASFFSGLSLTRAAGGALGAFVLLNALLYRARTMKADKLLLFFSVFLYFILTSASAPGNTYYYIAVTALFALLTYYTVCHSAFEPKLGKKTVVLLYVLLGCVFTLYVGGLTTMKYLQYRSPGFDFGIFAQMFYYMKTTFLPLTTCERDGLLSHFAVHISPIYYLLLPFFAVFESPVTLQIMQAVLLASGLVPLYLLCKKFGLPSFITAAAGAVYTFFPSVTGGCFYDLHENKFLLPLILWLFYFIEKNKAIGIFAFALLVFAVKEDAPVYVAFIALYMVFGRKDVKKGVPLFVMSIAYFGLALWLLKRFGLGAMVGRYDNYGAPGDGLLGVVKALAANPAYVLAQCFNEGKLVFLLRMLVPLAFLPLINRQYAKYILLGPMVLVNLMSDYELQHSIDFQYTYGSAAILFYLFLSNISSFKPRPQRAVAIFCVAATLMLYANTMLSKTVYFTNYFAEQSRTQTYDECLALIPDDAEVSASAFLVSHLYDHKILYELPTKHKTEYVAFDFAVATEGVSVNDYLGGEYETLYYKQDVVALFKLKP